MDFFKGEKKQREWRGKRKVGGGGAVGKQYCCMIRTK